MNPIIVKIIREWEGMRSFLCWLNGDLPMTLKIKKEEYKRITASKQGKPIGE